MVIKSLLTETQIGLLEEALNIGAGNSITALSQILQCDTDMSFPVLKGYLTPHASDILQNVGDHSLTIEMNIVGELRGCLVVVIPESDGLKLTNVIRQAAEEQRAEGITDLSIITETSNIMGGAFLTAIHDFCGLNIFHTIPVAEKHDLKYLDIVLQKYTANASKAILVITNEFMVNKFDIKAYLLVVLTPDSTTRLIQAIEKIRAV